MIKENIMYGLFENNILIAIAVIYIKKFNNIKTLYINEFIINDDYLYPIFINYIVLTCPKFIDYISILIKPTDLKLIKFAEKYEFILQPNRYQEKLLFVRPNDVIERNLIEKFILKSKSLSLSSSRKEY